MSSILRVISLAAFGWLLAASGAIADKGDRETGYADTATAVVQLLEGSERLPLPIERLRAALKAHYVDNAGTIYWVGTGRMTPFIQRLSRAADDGLNPADYPTETLKQIRDEASGDDIEAAARGELLFSAFFVAYAADLKIGRTVPQKIDPLLFRSRKTIDVLKVLTDLNKYRDPGEYLAAFEPKNPHYQSLKKLLRFYRAQAEDGGWDQVDVNGPAIKPGASDPRIPQIRQILQKTGDFEGADDGVEQYDEPLINAVKRFQTRHGLEAKGLLGKQTLLAMNIPIEERIKQITLNMERWRWMPEALGNEHILVNIAAFELQRVQPKKIERMNVVVGAVATQTPEFSDELEYVELNPTWTVPYDIATKEMLPKLRSNPMAFSRDFEVFASGKLTSWSSVNWASYDRGNFPFTFRQKPGPKNALGKVKFMLPNRHNIYLHDTPAKDKFAATTRTFSHGCIRLSKPVDFAYTILGEVAGWSKDKVDGVWATKETERVSLPRKIPVHLIYATAFLGDGGEVEFRADVYGRDRKLYNALFAKPTS